MVKRRVNVKKHVYTMLITVSIFTVGFFVGYLVTREVVSTSLERMEAVRLKIMGGLLQPELTTCMLNITRLNEERYWIGKQVEMLEREYGKNNRDVILLKENYMLLVISHFTAVEKWKEECGGNFTVVLFFYSNVENREECENQGIVLDAIHRENSDVLIFSIDTGIENPAIKSLIEMYKVRRVPSVVIEGKLYEGFLDKQRLEDIIGV